MNPRYILCAILVLLVATTALAADRDPLTGQPLPALLGDAGAAGPIDQADRDGDLVFLTHIADGTSKSVRALPNDVVVWQNGAWLVATDLSVPEAPVELGRYLLTAQPSDMEVMGSTLYIALRKTAGLLILDYADPAAPVEIGRLEGFDLLSVAVDGDRAFCGRGTTGVLVVDLTDPTMPAEVGTFDTPGSANGTDVAGNTLFVAQGVDGLGIYDVTDPLAPVDLANPSTSGFCTYVQVRDGVAYACDGDGIRLFDVSAPAAPALLSSYNAGDTCYEMAFTDDPTVVYLVGLSGMFVLMVADPANPVVLDAASVGNSFSCADAGAVAVVTSRYTGLHVLGDSFDEVANLGNGGFSMRTRFDGDVLYVTDLSGGVRVFDVSDLAAPVQLTEIPTRPNCYDVAIADDVLYEVNADNSGAGLEIFDVADPAAPAPLASFNTTNQTQGLGLEGDLLLLANGFGGLRSVDVANPATPMLLGDLPFGANATDVVPVGNVAFAVSFGGGMLSVDITDPTAMSIIQQQFWGFLNGLDITDQIAWVADGQLGLRVVDISDPTNLTTLATQAVGGQTRDVARARLTSEYVYLADDFYGLRQVEVSDPTAPLVVGNYPSADRGMGVDIQDGIVALAAGEAGVYLFREPGVVAIEPGDETAPELPSAVTLNAGPNPFNPRLAIDYTIPRAGTVRLDVFDARGRHVRTLLQAEAAAGAGSIVWNGVDAGGRPVASGVYSLRLVTDETVVQRQVTLVR
jgi:hypothetical protein